MFGKNQRLVVTLCAASILFGFDIGINSSASGQNQSSAATNQSYYHRPDAVLEPDEFLARSQQTNTDSVLQQYEQMLRRNSGQPRLARPPSSPANSTVYDVPSGFVRQQLPSQLVPPVVNAARLSTNTTLTNRNVDSNVTPLRPVQQKKRFAQPGFSLSDAQAPATRQTTTSSAGPLHRQATGQRNLQPTHTRANSTTARIVPPRHQGAKQARPVGARARIVSYVQDIPAQDQPQSNNPFAEPPADILGPGNRSTQGDPFADPPADVLQSQPRDPFDEPPADIRNDNPSTGRPVDEPDPPAAEQQPAFPGVDPFPNTPDSVNPDSDTSPKPQQTEPRDPEVAPDRIPNNGATAPVLRRGEKPYRTGPYQSFNGYQPKPLLEPPPERYLPNYSPQQIPQPFYNVESPDQMLSQPTLVSDGFETAQLYQGSNYDDDTRLASYECDACNQPGSLRMPFFDGLKNRIARIARIGCYDYQTCDVGCGGSMGQRQWLGQGRLTMGQSQLTMGRKSRLVANQLSIGPVCGGCGGCPGCSWGDSSFNAPSQNVSSRVFDAARPVVSAPCDDVASSCCCEPMFYFAAFGGYSHLDATDVLAASPLSNNGSLEFDDGFGVGLSMGQWQGRNLRTEIEYVFRRNDIASINRIPSQNQNVDGSINVHAGMFNAVWDFNRRFFGFRPYAGAGVGFAFFDYEVSDLQAGGFRSSSSGQSSFAYQFITGVSRQCSTNKEWFAEYRYFRGDSVRFNIAELSGESGYESNNFFFGFRKRF